MAHTTTHLPVASTFVGSVAGVIARFFSAFGAAMVHLGENSQKMRQINALQALSDEELASRGLKREDIARYVMSDCYWI